MEHNTNKITEFLKQCNINSVKDKEKIDFIYNNIIEFGKKTV